MSEETIAMKMTADSRGPNLPPSTLVRWCRFNFVGGIGIAVQFVALFLLKSVLHFNYLAATAIAVEAAVVHNFVWHEQFTWADRTKPDGKKPDRIGWRDFGWHDFGWRSAFSAAIKLPFSAKALAAETPEPGIPSNRHLFAELKRCATQNPYSPSIARFLRFNLTTGAVSIIGNLALMKVMVGLGHMNYLAANAIAIALCSAANFLVSEQWVFVE
jgi:putative flippase GtrA